ncbi:Holin-like protein CidA [Pseudoalteromonas holothuriae]|uniref:Holin-like protein CidA n=1 Tax=Pseudoalteromonas holothuriae TaxID=2963714 RepID=A0ABM9GID7_9GAMM|nr:Holin-like protein CidA [Pseudoalteromonas sp. CIP111951]
MTNSNHIATEKSGKLILGNKEYLFQSCFYYYWIQVRQQRRRSLLVAILKFFVALSLLLACLYSAKLMTLWWQVPLPAPLVAMIFMLILLSSKMIQPNWLTPACEPILKYMALFFIPAGVGIVQHTPLLILQWPLLLSILIVVPTVGICLVAIVAQKGLKDD